MSEIKVEIETEYTKEITCPYCGHEYNESYEFIEHNDKTEDCVVCGKTFCYEVDHDITYTTWKKEE
jgi:transcription elongation factor Elf1